MDRPDEDPVVASTRSDFSPLSDLPRFSSMTSPARRERLRLLWVKAGRLLPVDTGGKLRSYHLAKALANKHDFTLLTYYDGPRDHPYERELATEFPGAVTVRHGPIRNGVLATGLWYASTVWSKAPFAVTKFTAPRVRRLISGWMRERRFDAIICDFLSASKNFVRPEDDATLLFQHNVESSLWERQARYEANPVLRAVYSLEAAKMRRYEPRTVRRFRHVVAVSEHDRQLMMAMTDPDRITVVPTGVDANHYARLVGQPPDGDSVLFLGSMDWEANIDGVEWMCRDIWPRILAAVPTARFRIVGRNPHPRVTRLASDTVDFTGSVPTVDPYLARAAVFVVPLRIGGGTRLKIFEAMSAGRAVVSTSVGAEGLPVQHGENILLADDPASFADAVIQVLTQPGLRESLGRQAVGLARRHDWSAVAEVFEDTILRVCRASMLPPETVSSR
jgi:glycosyltransferase involved in cell wall biosynthesis